MPDTDMQNEHSDISDGEDPVSNRTRRRCWSEECQLMTIITLCFLFVISMFLAVAIVSMNFACTNNPCNPYCPKGYSPTTNDSDPCNERTQEQTVSHEKRSTKSHLQPPKGNSWYDQLNASATDANRINCVVCAEARPKIKIVGYPIPNDSLTTGNGVGWGPWSAIMYTGANMTQVHPLDCLLKPMKYE